MNFFGATDVDEVLDAMEYAAYAHDVQHVVIDNLQFMLGSATGRGFERFDAQERALERFRGFATEKNVHISLVVHPRCVARRALRATLRSALRAGVSARRRRACTHARTRSRALALALSWSTFLRFSRARSTRVVPPASPRPPH